MDIGEMIIKDHNDFRSMLNELRHSSTEEVELRKRVLSELMHRLAAHHVGEETTLFPAMEEIPQEREFALELIEEHRSMEILYTDLERTPFDQEVWVPRIRPILEIHETHMAREESSLIPRLPSMFSAEKLDEMGIYFARILEEEMKKKVYAWRS
jgi:hemerythrin superfamily protein